MLSRPTVYNAFQRAIGGPALRERFIAEHLKPQEDDRVLDIGCGPGRLPAHLPPVEYLGVDVNPAYVEAARREFGDRARFEVLDVTQPNVTVPADSFDLAAVLGVAHHLDDEELVSLFELAAHALVDTGRLVMLENTYVEGQGRVAKWVIDLDRGVNIRSPEAYRALAERAFEEVRFVVREDLLRIPYTHVILECASPKAPKTTKT